MQEFGITTDEGNKYIENLRAAARMPYVLSGVLERKYWLTDYGTRALAMAVQRPIVLWYEEDCTGESKTTAFNVYNYCRYVGVAKHG